jgi:transposase
VIKPLDKEATMRKMDLTLVRDQAVFVGIDVSKRRYAVAVRSGGHVIYRTVVPALYAHLRALWRCLPGCRIHAVYEAGFSGFGLCDQLTADGIDACVTPPSKMARSGDRVKTDRLDAEKLARELERGALRRCRVLSPAQREAREWSRYLNQLVAQQTRLKNQIKMRLSWYGITPALDRAARWSRAYRDQVRSLVGEATPLGVIVRDMLTRLAREEEQVLTIKRRLRALARSDAYRNQVRLLSSVPGIGWLTAIRLALELGDLSAFRNGRAFAAYLGLTPSEYSTGDRVCRGRITGQGNKWVRTWLIEAAWKAITIDPILGARFRRIAPRPTDRKRAIVAVARTLALRLRACSLSGHPYQIGVVC